MKAGDLIGVSDTTGYSAGNHLHFEGDPMSLNASTGKYGVVFPDNGYDGAVDISPWFNGIYADTLTEFNLLTKLVNVLQALLNALRSSKINSTTA